MEDKRASVAPGAVKLWFISLPTGRRGKVVGDLRLVSAALPSRCNPQHCCGCGSRRCPVNFGNTFSVKGRLWSRCVTTSRYREATFPCSLIREKLSCIPYLTQNHCLNCSVCCVTFPLTVFRQFGFWKCNNFGVSARYSICAVVHALRCSQRKRGISASQRLVWRTTTT